MISNSQVATLSIRCNRLMQRLIVLQRCLFEGFWLGIVDKEVFCEINLKDYDRKSSYQTEEHNLQGLWHWEEKVIAKYLQPTQKVLLAGAGGGREVLALHALGYQVDAFECHPGLVSFANQLLAKQGVPVRVMQAEPDQCPELAGEYDGAIIGWGAYTHIQNSSARIQFLRQLRARLRPGSPLILSFWHRRGGPRPHAVKKAVANAIRWLRGMAAVEVGDGFYPFFAHSFNEEEIRAELADAGFQMDFYTTRDYGHAVGIAE